MIVPDLLQAGLQHQQAGRLAEAEACYRRVLAAQPDHADALHLLGGIAHQAGHHDLAAELIGLAIRLDGRNPIYFYNLGVSLKHQGKLGEAAAAFRQAVFFGPNNADAHTGLGNVLKELKRFDEALTSYDQALALKPDSADVFNRRGNVLRQLNRPDEALASYDRALALRPGHAEAHNNRGVVLLELKRAYAALASYERALALRPDYAEALDNRGVALVELQRVDEALASHDQALALKPCFAEAFSNRGVALLELNRVDEALASFDRALALKPDHVEALHNCGLALMDLNRSEEALASFDRALALRPYYADARLARGQCLLAQGDFDRGWRDLEWRWQTEQMKSAQRRFMQPLWLGEDDLRGRTILLHAEQGFGDTIQFCRFAKQVERQGATVVLEVQPELRRLIASLDSTIQVVARTSLGGLIPEFDCHCPLISLPLAFKTTLETIPAETRYLSAPEEKTRMWRDRLGAGTKPRIGLVWAGSPRKGMPHANRIDRQRSIAFDELAPLFAHADCDFYSLQKGDDAIAQLRRSPLGARVVDWTDALSDFSDTAALIENFDLVIGVDTAVAHLVGALGKPFWLMNRFNTCWRWRLEGEDSPWYPTARIFRQKRLGEWGPVIEQIGRALQSWCGGWSGSTLGALPRVPLLP